MTQADSMKRWGLLAVALSAALIVPSALGAAFHCDETNVFRHVTSFGLGDFTAPGRPGLLWLLMTPALWLDDPAKVALALRLSALGASAVTLWAVWRLTLRAADATSALAAVLLLGTSMSWQAHSFEVRTDTYVLPATLLVMLLLWRPSMKARDAVLVGLLMAAAGLFSQKSIYNAAAIGAGWAALVALGQTSRRLARPLLSAGVAVAGVALWYGFLHWQNSGGEVVGTNLSLAATNAFDNPRPVSTNLKAWGMAANRAPVLYLGLLPGGWLAIRRSRDNGQLLAMAAAALVMASTIFFHRGFFMYFIASFEPYLAVVSGAGLVWLLRRIPQAQARRAATGVIVVLALAVSAMPYRDMLQTSNAAQITLMRNVEEVFPEPVPYFDGVGLVPGYPETSIFLTKANRLRLRERMGPGALMTLAQQRKPLFFIHNYMTRETYLEASEDLWIWTNFVPYRPNLYVRGGRVRVRAGQEQSARLEIASTGPYTVWFWGGWRGEASVNDLDVKHGQVIDLEEGDAVLRATADRGAGQLWLIHGAGRDPKTDGTDELVDYSMFPTLVRKRFQQYDKPYKINDLQTQATDPALRRMPESERVRRRLAHRAWQQMADAKLAAAQQGVVAAGPTADPEPGDLSPEEREDRAMLQVPVPDGRRASPPEDEDDESED